MLHLLSEAISPLSIGFLGIIFLTVLKNKLYRVLLGVLPCIILFTFSTPLLSGFIQQSLANEFLPRTWADDTNMAVLLGGGVDSSIRSRAQLGPSGDRLLVTKEYYDAGWFETVLVSGGSYSNQKLHKSSEDRNILITFGIEGDDVLDEHSSQTTFQNAVNAKKWIEKNPSFSGSRNVYLITSALHMRRAMFEFCLQGIDATPLVANLPSIPKNSGYREFLPFVNNLRLNSNWFSEELGRLFRRITSNNFNC